jgi:hypothetical protein
MFDAVIVAPLVVTALLSTTKNAELLGVSTGLYPFVVGACRGLAIVGLFVGLIWWPMEIVAASGVALLMIAAMDAHRRAGEPAGKALPAFLGLVLAAGVISGQVLMLAQ